MGIVVLVALLLLLALLKRIFVVVQQGSVAVMKRWGKYHRVLDPGPHFTLNNEPYPDTYFDFPVSRQTK